MIKKIIIVVICLLLFVGNSEAENMTGKKLLEYLERKDESVTEYYNLGIGLGFLQGIVEWDIMTADLVKKYVPTIVRVQYPENYNIVEASKIVINHLKRNPEDLHLEDRVLVLGAFIEAYGMK